MATDNHSAVRQGKMYDGISGFEVGVQDLVERNSTHNAGDLSAKQWIDSSDWTLSQQHVADLADGTVAAGFGGDPFGDR